MQKYVFQRRRPKYLVKNRRLKALIRHLVTQSEKEISFADFPISGSSLFSQKKVPFALKCIFVVTFCICILVFGYQTYVRTSYYFDYHTVVDVIQTSEEFDHPAFYVVAYDTAAMCSLWNRSNLDVGRAPFVNFHCVNPLLGLMNKGTIPPDVTLKQIWNATNITTSMLSFKVVSKQKMSHLKMVQDEVLAPDLGIVTRFRFGTSVVLDNILSIPTYFALIFFPNLHTVNRWMSSYQGSSFEVIYAKKNPDFCNEHTYVILVKQIGDATIAKISYPVASGSEKRLSFTYLKYSLIDTPKSHCLSFKDHAKCFKNCVDKKHRELNCKFPFATTNLPECNLSDPQINKLFIKLLFIFHSTQPERDCGCIKKCVEYSYEPTLESTRIAEDKMIFNFYFRSKEITAYVQHLSFDTISLLSEIGGTLGITMGLSLLSLIECVRMVRIMHKQQKHLRNTRRFHLVKKIGKIRKKLIQQNGPSTFHAVKVIIICVLIGFTVYLLYWRIVYYMNEPTTSSVDIIRPSTVQFPIVTICGESLAIHKLKRKANGNKNLGCEKINHLQLINEKNTADRIWDLLSIHSTVSVSDSYKFYAGTSLHYNGTKTTAILLYGTCTQMKMPLVNYTGATTGLTFQLMPFPKSFFCDEHKFWYILNSPDENIDLSMATDVQAATRSNVYIRIKKIVCLFPTGNPTQSAEMRKCYNFNSLQMTRLNVARNKCVNKKIHLHCLQQCLKQKLQEQLSCRLPYMTDFDIYIPMCTNFSSSLKSQHKYVDIYMGSDAYKSCHCLPSCTKTIITSSVMTEKHALDQITIVTNFLLTNYIEHLLEIQKYTGDAFISDIGSILGIGLGLSILSVFNIASHWSAK